jgi:hypothetical protein
MGAQQSPRAAASRFIEAWNARQWRDAAQQLDLALFDRFRRDFIARTRRSGEEGPRMTVEELRKNNPDMPLEVAEYQVRMMEEQRRRYADPTPYEFARVSSAGVLRNLDAAEAAARWLESRDPQWQVRMQFEQAGCPAPDDVDQIPSARRTVLGELAVTDSIAYVLVQEERDESVPAWAGGDLTVLQLARRGERWVVVPRGDLVPEVGSVDVKACKERGVRN